MKFISIVPPLFLVFACAQKHKLNTVANTTSYETPKVHRIDTLLHYKSANNGSADIKLTMLDNHTFDFHLQTLPPTDSHAINAKLVGVWEDQNEHKRLTFKGDKKLLKTIFDSATISQNKQFVVINDSVVDVNDKVSGIFIGGILCEKKTFKRP